MAITKNDEISDFRKTETDKDNIVQSIEALNSSKFFLRREV